MYAVCFTVLLSYIKLLSILGVCLKCISKVHSVWVDCWVTECTHCMCCWVYSVYMYVSLCLGWDGATEGGWTDRLLVGPVPATHGPQTTGSHGPGLLFISAAITNLVYLHDRFFLKQRFINVILFSVGASLRDRRGNSARWFWGSGLPPCVC